MRSKWILTLTIGLALCVALGTASAYERYNSGCNDCHGVFDGPTSTKGSFFPGSSKHTMHISSAEMNKMVKVAKVGLSLTSWKRSRRPASMN